MPPADEFSTLAFESLPFAALSPLDVLEALIIENYCLNISIELRELESKYQNADSKNAHRISYGPPRQQPH